MRNDAENIRKLEALKPRHEHLKTLSIRLTAELERREADLKAAEAEALELVGTSNEDEIRAIITENWKANTEAVDQFEAMIAGIENELKAIGDVTAASSSQSLRPPNTMRPFAKT